MELHDVLAIKHPDIAYHPDMTPCGLVRIETHDDDTDANSNNDHRRNMKDDFISYHIDRLINRYW
jgi:hypothetical protein